MAEGSKCINYRHVSAKQRNITNVLVGPYASDMKVVGT